MMKVSHILLTYNQEKYVREALESVLAQTYQDVEVVVSDDCSTDGTWTAITEILAGYSGNKHIIKNRNPSNFGLIGNYNKALSLCSGEILVASAGDDSSLPHRVEKLVEYYLKFADTMIVYSNLEVIDDQSIASGSFYPDSYRPNYSRDQFARTLEFNILGASISFRRRIVDTFGYLPADTPQEDWILPFRALLLGTIIYTSERLVKYRVHDQSISNFMRSRSERGKRLAWKEAAVTVWMRDLNANGHRGLQRNLNKYRVALWLEKLCETSILLFFPSLAPYYLLAGRYQTKKHISRQLGRLTAFNFSSAIQSLTNKNI